MSPRKCFCGACSREHSVNMTSEEFRAMATLPGALSPSGFLTMACPDCEFSQEEKDGLYRKLMGDA